MTERFDDIIIGAGQAGPALANRLTATGRKVAVIERHLVGGTCVNTGCKPTKTMVASAYAAHLARRGADFGVGTGPISIDMAKVAAARGKDHFWTRAAATNPGSRECPTSLSCAAMPASKRQRPSASAKSCWKRNASSSMSVAGPPYRTCRALHDVPYLTNAGMIALQTVPEHPHRRRRQLYRAGIRPRCSAASAAEVTIVEMGPHLVGREDIEISEEIRKILEAEGIAIRTSATCIQLFKEAHGISVGVNCTEGAPRITGSHVLLATGRRPNTDDLGLDKAGIKTDTRGYIEVDDGLATSVPGIWAMGDCNGRGAFTHTAWNDYEIVAANLLDGDHRKVSDRILGYALYIDPPLGRVGMTLAQAKASGRKLLTATRPMSRVGRATEKDETQGFMSLIADAETKQILGAAILGTSGDEAIHGVLDVMNAKAPVDTLRWAVPIHPTVSELWPTLVNDLREDVLF